MARQTRNWPSQEDWKLRNRADSFQQHVVVIGCGLAGLTVAIALAQGGHKVTIVESAPLISYIGAGSYLFPSIH